MTVRLDKSIADETGSFRVQLSWPNKNVFRNNQKRELQGLAGVAALNFASIHPTSSAYLNDEETPLGDKVTPLMLFDIKNPWATYLEFFSTHPMIGNRLLHLQNVSDSANFLNVENLNQKYSMDMGVLEVRSF